MVGYPIIYRVFLKIPGGLFGISEPSNSMANKKTKHSLSFSTRQTLFDITSGGDLPDFWIIQRYQLIENSGKKNRKKKTFSLKLLLSQEMILQKGHVYTD